MFQEAGDKILLLEEDGILQNSSMAAISHFPVLVNFLVTRAFCLVHAQRYCLDLMELVKILQMQTKMASPVYVELI